METWCQETTRPVVVTSTSMSGHRQQPRLSSHDIERVVHFNDAGWAERPAKKLSRVTHQQMQHTCTVNYSFVTNVTSPRTTPFTPMTSLGNLWQPSWTKPGHAERTS